MPIGLVLLQVPLLSNIAPTKMPPRMAAARMIDSVKHTDEPDHQVRSAHFNSALHVFSQRTCNMCFLCRMSIKQLQMLMLMTKQSAHWRLFVSFTNGMKRKTNGGTTTQSSLDLFALLDCCSQFCTCSVTHTFSTKCIPQSQPACCLTPKQFHLLQTY